MENLDQKDTAEEIEAALRENFAENRAELTKAITAAAHEMQVFERFDTLAELISANAHVHGWNLKFARRYELLGEDEATDDAVFYRLSMIASELFELAEAIRTKKQDYEHANIEMADVISRSLDLAIFLCAAGKSKGQIRDDATPGGFLAKKLRQNVDRDFLHGEKRF
jgi:NTP pyrophosphatase (non-canonical NTP hydrolase)